MLGSITRFIERNLKVTVNREKSGVRPADRFSFLSFRFHRGSIRWTDEAFAEFKRRVRKLTGRSGSTAPMAERIRELSVYVRGWVNYFGIAEYYRPVPEIDAWIRRRVRMCCLKQWRLRRTRINRRMALGVYRRTAVRTGFIERGWWYLSGVLAAQWAMSGFVPCAKSICGHRRDIFIVNQ